MTFQEVIGLASASVGAVSLVGGYVANNIGHKLNKVNSTLEKMFDKQNAQDVTNQRFDDKFEQINDRCKQNHK